MEYKEYQDVQKGGGYILYLYTNESVSLGASPQGEKIRSTPREIYTMKKVSSLAKT